MPSHPHHDRAPLFTPALRPEQALCRAGIGCRAALLVACTAVLSGCTVGFWSYQQIAAPEAQYVQVNCNGRDGPPKLAYYPFHGIFIAVAVSPLDLRLRTPRGVHAHLDGDSVLVSGHTDKGNVDLTLHLKTAAQASDGSSLAEMRFEERHDNGWQAGTPTSDAQIDTMTTGTIQLPPITIDGTAWPAQTLSFTRKVYTEVMKPNAGCPAPP
ncbi:MAG TPA: hypothetical protein VMC02_12425 [Steroidobacteraceae bacterium]|nr:hypothetical protein [Steroidobacteraceae bacterium]